MDHPASLPRLIVVEGLMGAGKTTVARAIHAECVRRERSAVLFEEGDPFHPADYEHCAWLDGERFRELAAAHPAVAAIGRPWEDGWLVFYGQHRDRLAPPLLEALRSHDVYDGTPLPRHRSLMLARWDAFARGAMGDGTGAATLFECCLLQNSFCKFVVQHDADTALWQAHLRDITGRLKHLDPLILYLDTDDIHGTLMRAAQERPPAWLPGVTEYYTGQAFGRRLGLAPTIEDLVAALTRRRRLELETLPTLPVRFRVLSGSLSREQRWHQILEAAGLMAPNA